jgi:hypothetical protein
MNDYPGHVIDLGDQFFQQMIELSHLTFEPPGRGFYSHLLAVVADSVRDAEDVLRLSKRSLGPERLYPLMGLDLADMDGRILSMYDPGIIDIFVEGTWTDRRTKKDIDNALLIDPYGNIMPGTWHMRMNPDEVDDLSGTGKAAMEWISRKVAGVTSIHKRTDGHVLAFRGGRLYKEAFYDYREGEEIDRDRMLLRRYREDGEILDETPIRFERGNLIYLPVRPGRVVSPDEEGEVAISA